WPVAFAPAVVASRRLEGLTVAKSGINALLPLRPGHFVDANSERVLDCNRAHWTFILNQGAKFLRKPLLSIGRGSHLEGAARDHSHFRAIRTIAKGFLRG